MFHSLKPLQGVSPRRSRVAVASTAVAMFILGVLLSLVGGATAAATAVPLGTAGTYAVLAGSGIFNTGATTIRGDTGSSPTSTETGFAACPGAADCVTQNGANHADPDPNDAATTGAKLALRNAYSVAAGQSPTTIPTELAGQVLTPGVYSSLSGTFGMTGTLTLDGGGDPNATFIFQTADGTGTLITDSTGNVNLIGSAQACNIYWKVGSSATLGSGSNFSGNILANTSITLDLGVTVTGSLLAGEQQPSGSGAVTLNHDTITTASCATSTPPPATSTTATTAPVTTTSATTTATTTPVSTTATAAGAAAGAAPARAAKALRAAASRIAVSRAAASKAAAVARVKAARLRAEKRAARRSRTSTAVGNARRPVHHVGLTG